MAENSEKVVRYVAEKGQDYSATPPVVRIVAPLKSPTPVAQRPQPPKPQKK